MDYVNLGRTGLRVSRICLGMMSYGRSDERPWALDEEAAESIVRRAAESGVIFFDTADVYNGGESEVVTGRLLKKLFPTREEYVVATKVHGRTMPGVNGAGLSRKHVRAFPLARGLLAGNRTREGEKLTTRARTDAWGDSLYTPELDFAVVDRVAEVAAARGVPAAQVALAWLLHKPGVTAPIVGATKLEHLDDAVAAEQLTLDPAESARLEEPYAPHSVAGHS